MAAFPGWRVSEIWLSPRQTHLCFPLLPGGCRVCVGRGSSTGCRICSPEVASALGIGLARGVSGRIIAWLRDRSLRSAVLNVAIGRLMRDRLIGFRLGQGPGGSDSQLGG